VNTNVASEKENRLVIIYLLYEKSWKNITNMTLYMIFIDFKQAYDSINKNQLWVALEDFSFPSKLVRLIRNCNTFCRVRFVRETSSHVCMEEQLHECVRKIIRTPSMKNFYTRHITAYEQYIINNKT